MYMSASLHATYASQYAQHERGDDEREAGGGGEGGGEREDKHRIVAQST